MKPIERADLHRGQFHFLASRSPNRILLAVMAGIAGGIAYAALVPLILLSLAPVSPTLSEFTREVAPVVLGWQIQHWRFAVAFLLLCIFALLARAASQILFGNVVDAAAAQLRLYLSERIRRLPIADLEAIGPSRLQSAIVLDVARMVDAAPNLPAVLINISTIFCALAFIAFLHIKVFLLVVAVIVLGVVSYRLPLILGQRSFARARDNRDGIQESIRGQLYGAKELRLNAGKYHDFMERGMRRLEAEVVRLSRRGNIIFYLALQYGNLIGFLAIGVVTYVAAARYGLSSEVLLSVVMAMLYIIGPINVIVNAIPALAQGTVALNKLNELLDRMPVEDLDEGGMALPCDELQLREVSYSYADRDGFRVGPVSLTLRRGQVTFLVGGNGSGKSTLAKLITGHYRPVSGEVLFDHAVIDESNLFRARQSVSAIFLDFHLFTHLFGASEQATSKAEHYLHRLGLAHKVTLDDQRFSTIDLSDGQRKRLALLVAFLEQRDIYVFDEWAADQDPEFKHVFYTELLPELRRLGRIVVVISHDDRYFDQADQLVRMSNGQVTAIQ